MLRGTQRRFNALSEQIIGAAFEVSNVLGTGFLEKVYENALNIELNLRGLQTFQQAPLKVFYKDELVGDYIADILVENEIIIEVKAVKEIDAIHFAQCLNYLRITGLRLCLLLNFSKPRQLVPIIVPRSEKLNIFRFSCRFNQPDIRQINRTAMTFPSF